MGIKSEAGRPEDLEIRRLLAGKERKRKRAKTPDIPRKRARDSSVEVIERFDGNLPHDSRPSRLKRKRIHDLKTTQPQKVDFLVLIFLSSIGMKGPSKFKRSEAV